MNNEFKVKNYKDATVYILEESATAGATSTGAGATVSKPLGKGQIVMQSRMGPKETKPRNFVAKNAKMGGAGAHKDKKKAAKQGDVKHKAKELEVAEAYGRRSSYGYNPDRDAQDQWDAARRADQDFRNRERNAGLDDEEAYYQQQVNKDRGPWYLKIDGKIYKQKGIPKSFDWKSGASKYGMAILKNNPNLQGKIFLTKKAEDDQQAEDHGDVGKGWGQGSLATAYPSSALSGAGHDDRVRETGHPDEKQDKALIRKMVKAKALKQEDGYVQELHSKLAEKIPANAPVSKWIDDFTKAAKTPNAKGHHQFKNKSPEKVRQMAVAASYGAKNPKKKK